MAKETGKLAVQLIGAGVLGSAFTLIGVTQFDLLNTDAPEEQNKEVVNQQAKQRGEQATQVNHATQNLSDIIAKASPSVVGVVNYGQHPFQQQTVEQGVGSGVIYKIDGDKTYIVTNNHVIEQAMNIEVSLHDGERVPAKLIGTDVFTDLAVLEIATIDGMEPLPFGKTTQLQMGQDVIAIGNPLGLNLSSTVTKGIISGLDRTVPVETSQGNWELNVLQTDAAINPGNSGGALLNLQGEVIGINTLKIASEKVEGLGFAIPSEEVQTVVDELLENGEIKRPMLGVRVIDLSQYANPYAALQGREVMTGLSVDSVEPDSIAQKAGMQRGDIIKKLNDVEIESMYDLRKFLYRDVKEGDVVTATVLRNEKPIQLQLQF
ncbi:trypsin-like peptidase domain-containing protein [Savagea sp. SN6]|uniref:Trypsin-like peptidase domain-containing protein n=1 Tax=Savagea serpentis TaxID=2785297 RepID=A0A8J7G3I5_9BACL|nr:trypsin-like peptidase domain-containing protein [Savagea serpentis]MBF4500747.1 trypsin-like peptidase domain-containing protein [Savagea serpentis]